MNRREFLDLHKSIVLPEAGVKFESEDKVLVNLFQKAEALAQNNIKQFTPQFQLLVEGGGYDRIYTETQPMGGEMYAKRNLHVALNNQLLFLLCQRDDGRLPGGIFPTPETENWQEDPIYMYASHDWMELGLVADFSQLQGNALPFPAFKMYYLAGKPAGYLELLGAGLEAYDAYLWRTRDPNHEGVLQSWCIWDTGEDHCHRFGGSPNRWPHDYPPTGKNTPDQSNPRDRERYYLWCSERELHEKIRIPFRSMDMMAYSYENRAVSAMISEVLCDGRTDFWRTQAENVRNAFMKILWRPERGAAYDKDRDNRFMDTLVHNNLRCMWYGLFDQEMADEFVSRHLLNPEEFLTPFPLPSIAANDPVFCNIPDNNWSGPPQGLTWQRLVRALENYGHYSDLTMLGRRFMQMIRKTGMFVQQFDPFDTKNPVKGRLRNNGYGPTVLSFLEYVSRFYGVHVERDQVYWSGLADGGKLSYAQRFGDKTFELENNGLTFSASVNGIVKFSCSTGVRVCSDINGKPQRIIGIDTVPHQVTFNSEALNRVIDVKPNQIFML